VWSVRTPGSASLVSDCSGVGLSDAVVMVGCKLRECFSWLIQLRVSVHSSYCVGARRTDQSGLATLGYTCAALRLLALGACPSIRVLPGSYYL
jgi:hypothetical protein